MRLLGASGIFSLYFHTVSSLSIHSDRPHGDYETGEDIELAFSTEDTENCKKRLGLIFCIYL